MRTMSRWEFMRKLEELLSDISPSEREEALKYYNDYINDGGKENEEEVISSLGTPEQVAAIVRNGIEGSGGEFTESGFKNETEANPNPVAHYQRPGSYDQNRNPQQQKSGMSGGMIALIVVLCVIFSPVIVGFGGAFFGVIVSIVTAVFAIFLALGICSIVFVAVGVALIVVGLFRIFFGPLTGFAMIAVGLVLAGIGLLFFLLTSFIIVKVIPAIFKGIGHLFSSIFGGKRGSNNE